MPGVSVTTGTISGPSAPARAPSSTYFAAGLTERGPITPPTVRNAIYSFNQFVATYGARPSFGTAWDDIKTFFEEGGTRLYFQRIVGPAAAAGTLGSALADRATTPDDTLTVAAASPGAWSSRVSLNVVDGPTAATYRIQVMLDGAVVEDFTNLSSPQNGISKINATSQFIRLADAGSTTAAPNNNPKATTTPVTIAAGTDDRASINTASYIAALDKFSDGLGDGIVALPGIGPSVHTALIAHADAHNRVAALAGARGDDKATMASYAASIDAKRAGYFAPWVQIQDGFGGVRAISPEGFVAACRARAHERVGPWKAAAGETGKARFLVGPDQVFTPAEANDLDGSKVNIIRILAGATRLYGWRSLAADVDNWGMLTGADVINRIVVEAAAQMEPYVFDVIDSSGHLLASVTGTLTGIVQPMASAGGLFAGRDPAGDIVDPGYKVTADDTNNPVQSLALNQILGAVGVRVSPTAAMVFIQVSKAGVTASL